MNKNRPKHPKFSGAKKSPIKNAINSHNIRNRVESEISDEEGNLDTDEFQSRNDQSYNMIGQNYSSIDKRGAANRGS
jgi:hypothetical protein